MTLFEFSIIASGLDPNADHFESQFYENGCDDALVSFQKGHVIIDFAREANCLEEAICSAMDAVWATGASIDRIEPDPLVSLSDIASRSEMTRAAVSQYANGRRQSGFPVPAAKITSDSPLWNWDDVAEWMYAREKVSHDVFIQARAVRLVNKCLANGEKDVRSYLIARLNAA